MSQKKPSPGRINRDRILAFQSRDERDPAAVLARQHATPRRSVSSGLRSMAERMQEPQYRPQTPLDPSPSSLSLSRTTTASSVAAPLPTQSVSSRENLGHFASGEMRPVSRATTESELENLSPQVSTARAAAILSPTSRTASQSQPSSQPRPFSAATESSDPSLSPAAPLSLTRHPNLALRPSPTKGRSVHATAPISARTVLETCPMLVLPTAEVEQHIRHTTLNHYSYNWPVRIPAATGDQADDASAPGESSESDREVNGENQRMTTIQTQAIPLGLGSLFNHSNDHFHCNVGWVRNIPSFPTSPASPPPAAGSVAQASATSAKHTIPPATNGAIALPPHHSNENETHAQKQVTDNPSITYTTLRAIASGEELCISYGADEHLTFVDVERSEEASRPEGVLGLQGAQQTQQGPSVGRPSTVPTVGDGEVHEVDVSADEGELSGLLASVFVDVESLPAGFE